MIKVEESNDDTPTVTQQNVGTICRFCLSDFPDSDMMWMQWQDWQDTHLSNMYERITQSKLPISQHISELCCSKCSELINQSYATLNLIERANKFWSNYIKDASTDYVVYEDEDDYLIKDEIHQEGDTEGVTPCEFKYVSLTISPATMDDVRNIQEQHSIHIYSCNHCRMGFNDFIEYQEHESSCRNMIQCNVCFKTFSDRSRLSTHKKRHDKGKYECDICQRKFSMRNYILSHMETHCKNLQYSCDNCKRCFRTKNSFYAHKKSHCSNTTGLRRKHNKANEKDYLSCHFCKQPYLAVLNLQRHYHKRHADQFDKICLDCNQKFSTIEQKNSHRATAHPDLQCPICKRTMLSQESLNSHISNHSKQDRPFICEICGAAFTRATHLKSHHRCVHTTERPFKCKICGYGFAENFSLTEHIKLKHSAEDLKPFPCMECGKRFLVRSALKAHMFIHTGIGRFKCDKCPMILRKAANLQQHHAIYHPVL